MPVDYNNFTYKWLERAERKDVSVDEADCFISLWISFNGWLKSKFGEELPDFTLIEAAKGDSELQNTFLELKRSNNEFVKNLEKFAAYTVADMRNIENTNRIRRYEGTFESLIRTIYEVRCNLFHGRKNLEDNMKDYELVRLSYSLLLVLFKKHLELSE